MDYTYLHQAAAAAQFDPSGVGGNVNPAGKLLHHDVLAHTIFITFSDCYFSITHVCWLNLFMVDVHQRTFSSIA